MTVVDNDAVYGCPSSPGANERVEQNPSDELMSKVKPSLDLRLLAKVSIRIPQRTLTMSNP